MKGDKLVGNYYVKFDQVYKQEISDLEAKGLSTRTDLHRLKSYFSYSIYFEIISIVALLILRDLFYHLIQEELTKEIKAHLLSIATQDVKIDGIVRPLLIAVTTTTASLYKCYTGELRHLKYPVLD